MVNFASLLDTIQIPTHQASDWLWSCSITRWNKGEDNWEQHKIAITFSYQQHGKQANAKEDKCWSIGYLRTLGGLQPDTDKLRTGKEIPRSW